jgi:alkylation response protein AidB-like acyl-CoA dehydrogenase
MDRSYLCLASQVAQRVSGLSIEQMGGVGFTRELGVEKYWRYVIFSILLTYEVIPRLAQSMKVTQYT